MFVLRLVIILLLAVGFGSAQQLRVAAASDLTGALAKLSPALENETGIHLNVSLGSSGNFFAQIQNGAPFDVFLSADRSYPEKLEQARLTEPGTLVTYARGKLVLWIPAHSPLHFATDRNGILSGNLNPLLGPSVQRIAIANPAHAPYGRAAEAVLRYYGMYDRLKPRLVLGENISQTAQFAQSGNAQLAFIAMALAVTPEMQQNGRFVILPQESYPPLDQAAVVVRSSVHKIEAHRFLQFLQGPHARQILHEFGFEVPAK